MSKLDKFFNRIIEAHVFLKQEKFRFTAEAKILVYGITFNSKEVSNEMTNSIDLMITKLENQLKKHKSKLRSHKYKETEEILEKPEQDELEEDLTEIIEK
jgi:putative sigma-54 modulation protein